MTDILSPGLDRELFGDDIDLELHRTFDMYIADPEAAPPDSVEPLAQTFDDLPATSIEPVTLSEIEGHNGLQDIELAAVTAPESSGDLLSDLFEASFAGEVGSGEGTQDSIFDWGVDNAVEHPGGLQGPIWATPPASQGSEDVQSSSDEEILAVEQVEDRPGTPTVEDLMAENARLKALLESQNVTPTLVKTPETPKTSPKKAKQPKTPQSTPRKRFAPRTTSRSPIKKPGRSPIGTSSRPLKGAALAISQQKGPIEAMWGAGTSPEKRHEIQKQLFVPPIQQSPLYYHNRTTPPVHPVPAVESEDPFNAQCDELLALCKEPIQFSPINFEFLTQPSQDEQFPHVAATCSSQFGAIGQGNSFAGIQTAQSDKELSLENAIFLRDLMAGVPQYDQEVPSQIGQQMQTFSPHVETRTPYQMPQASRRQSFSQHQQGAQIEYGGYTYTPASNNNTINAISPPQFQTPSPAAISTTATPTPTPTPQTKTKSKTPKRAPAKRTPSSTKVTKATKKAHQCNTSVPTPTTTLGRQRSLQELYAAQFITLTKDEKARLLLPLLQGIDPITGLPKGRPGTLGMASQLSAFNQGVSGGFDATAGMEMNLNSGIGLNMGGGMGMSMGMGEAGFDMNGGVEMGSDMDTNAFNMVQQAAAELDNDYAMNRQSEALERAAMLQAAGRRR